MLQRDESGAGTPIAAQAHGFIFDVEIQENGPSPERIVEKVADALMWVEGCGEVNVGYLGPMTPETDEDISVKV